MPILNRVKRKNKLFISDNVSLYNQRFVWMCRKLKRATEAHNFWSDKEIIKFRRTMEELPISVYHKSEIKAFYPDFIVKESGRTS